MTAFVRAPVLSNGALQTITLRQMRNGALPSGYAPGGAVGCGATDGAWTPVYLQHPLPVPATPSGESASLARANVAAPPLSVIGGDYISVQTCATHDSVALQALTPDRATYQTLATRTASDTADGPGVALDSGAIVRVAPFGTAGYGVALTRVP